MKRAFYLSLFFLFTLSLSAQTYDELVEKAMDYTERKDYIAAEQGLLAALRKEPGNAANSLLLANLGTVQRQLGKYEEALVSYNAAIAKYPDTPFLLHNRALLYCDMNRLSDALQDYSSILKLNPDDTEALYQRGLIYLTNKLPLASKADFDKIIYLEPNNLRAKVALAMILKRDGMWKEAEEAYTELLSQNKSYAELYFNRAECYLQQNKLARTQEDLTKAVELGYDEGPLYILRGQLRIAQFDKRSAKEDFLRAKEKGIDEKIINDLLLLCK